MYDWIWHRLPGRRLAKALQALAAVAAVVALLFLVVFPYVEPRLPWNRTVVAAPSTPPPAAPTRSVPSPGSPP